MLSGRYGLGISEFSQLLAAGLLCKAGSAGSPCGECKSCVLFMSGNHPDIVQVVPEAPGKQIKVDQIRDLVSFTQHTSQYGHRKLVIIDPAEAMNRNAANSLLKTLEEPPADTVFILVTYDPMRLPVTIRSRCQRIGFVPSYEDETISWLQQTMPGSVVDHRQLLYMAGGLPMLVQELLESDVAGKQAILAADLVDLTCKPVDIVTLAEKWREFGVQSVLIWLLVMLSNLICGQLGGDSTTSRRQGFSPVFKQLLTQFNLQQLVMCYDKTLAGYFAVSGPYNLNEQGILEDMLVFWQTLASNEEGNTL